MPSRRPSRAGLAVLAAVALLALSAAAATFDAVDRPAPDVTAPGADPDVSGGSAPNGSGSDAAGSLPDLASPFDWRTDSTGGPDAGDGLAVPVALALLVVCAVAIVAFLTGSDHDAAPDREREEAAAIAAPTPERPRWPTDAGENAVYRSWRRLADRLDAPPTESPAEIAAAARDRGLDRRAVGELTATFREVRYGGYPATPEREARATDAADRLEDDA